MSFAFVELMRSKFAGIDVDVAQGQWEESTAAALSGMRRHFEHLPPAEAEAKLADMRATMEQQLQGWLTMIAAAKAGRLSQPAQGRESPVSLGFSNDGRHLWCGTDHGLSVYQWDAVAAATGDAMPPARFSHTDSEGFSRYVHGVAEEPGGRAVVFGTVAGNVYRMDLSSGEVRHLLRTPEHEMVFDVRLTADGAALALCTQPSPAQRGRRSAARCAWSAWSYAALCGGAAEP
jgi:hypothetical protein